ncbi:MAG: asparagine--tRNA ligase [Clostridia bacterium]|nr:asparagine--tRNA ligase [Clostridia bacterium]MBO7155811.1 asparagine--tRNA ligase [Clostridia bacterium]
MKHVDIKKLLDNAADYVGKNVTVCGWVRTARDSKAVAFIELNDGTCLKNIQLIIDKEKIDAEALKNAMAVGTSLKIEGDYVTSPKNGYEVQVTDLVVLGTCPADFPLQKKRHTIEFLRSIPHLRVRTRYFESVFAVRSELAQAVHRYFAQNGYKYVHAPIITGSDCEGAGEMFRVTTHDFETEFKTEEEYYANDFFGKKAGLTVSAQLEGEIAAMGLGKIYTFGPTFRAEHSNTPRHLAEFWHIEPEVSFAEIDDIIEIAEDFIKYIIKEVMAKCPDELEFFNQWVEKGLIEKLQKVVSNDFARLSYTDAIEVLKKSGKEFKYPVEWGAGLQTEHEKYLADEYFGKPVFIVDYPADIKSFYMKQNADGKTVAATDLLVPGLGEIIGGSEREWDMDKLLAAMAKRGMPTEGYEEYLDTRKFGSVPHSGFGLGFDRMIMYITGVQNIRDTLMYPRTVGSL